MDFFFPYLLSWMISNKQSRENNTTNPHTLYPSSTIVKIDLSSFIFHSSYPHHIRPDYVAAKQKFFLLEKFWFLKESKKITLRQFIWGLEYPLCLSEGAKLWHFLPLFKASSICTLTDSQMPQPHFCSSVLTVHYIPTMFGNI